MLRKKTKNPSLAATKRKGLSDRLKQPYDNSSSTQKARILRHFQEVEPRLTVQEGRDMGILDPRVRISELRNHHHYDKERVMEDRIKLIKESERLISKNIWNINLPLKIRQESWEFLKLINKIKGDYCAKR